MKDHRQKVLEVPSMVIIYRKLTCSLSFSESHLF
jgi:hypothetical protein